jgi:serine/threonine protein kinase
MDVPELIAGRFRIECEIGTGGMGTVYRATHLGLQRSVAVKIIRSEFATDRDVADRFMREARTMARLRHQRAAMIFDAGSLPDGRHFIVMEYVEGRTLSQALREGRFSPQTAVTIATQICEVLEEAHQLGIIHRDLKPSNIMLNDRGVCVLDFGVAKVLASSTEVTATHASTGSGQIVGTPRYMSPEQCLGQRVGVRSDLYSLGVLLYEMLAGHPPFTDAMPSVVLVKQATAPPPPLVRLRQDVPRGLALAVHTLLAKRPEDRPLTAAAARAMLAKSIIGSTPITLPDVEPLSSTVAAMSRSRDIVLRIAAPLVLVSIMGALLLVLGYGGSTAETSAPDHLGPALNEATLNPPVAASDANVAIPSGVARSQTPTPAMPVSLTSDRARQIISSVSHGTMGDVAVVPATTGAAIVAVHEERRAGTTHFFVLERNGNSYRIAAHGPLDDARFRGAKWTAETMDIGGGRKAVLFTGRGAANHPEAYRLVLYQPLTHETFSLRFDFDRQHRAVSHAVWSNNVWPSDHERYREMIRQRARTLLNS